MVLALVAALLTAVPLPAGAAAIQPVQPGAPAGSVIRDNYIVRFVDGADAGAEAAALAGRGSQVDRVYQHVFAGALVRLPEQAVEALRRNPRVASVEADRVVSADIAGVQSSPPWGLDRSDQQYRSASQAYNYPNNGAGVTAYIVDTGIRADHIDFGGRVRSGYTAIQDGRGTTDCFGHGTHVAGTVGGSTYGMAKGVSLVSVRVLDCTGVGSYSGVIAGLDWVIADHTQGRPAVVNMSFGGEASSSIDDAVRAVIADGVTVVTSAGNDSMDACQQSPARVAGAITVGATDYYDNRASFSNWGPCLDLFAPGVSITSDSNALPTATEVMSGTSMASPHVAGAVAVLLAAQPSLTPAGAASTIAANAVPGMVNDPGPGSPKRLLYSPFGQPVNDNLSTASPFSFAGAGPLTANNVGATREVGEPEHAGVPGGGSLWWTFTTIGPGTVTLSTQGLTFDTLIGVYTGTSLSTLNQVAANDNASQGNTWSQVSLSVSPGVAYRVAVDGDYGRSGSINLGFTGSASVNTAAAPGPPTGVSAIPGDATADVSWTAPSSNGGSAITGYVITPYIGTTPGTPQSFTSTATTRTVTGLANGTAYTFKVAATNAVGTGPESADSNAVTPLFVEPGTFNPLSPARILDTRTGNGAPSVKLGQNQTLALQVAAGAGSRPAACRRWS